MNDGNDFRHGPGTLRPAPDLDECPLCKECVRFAEKESG